MHANNTSASQICQSFEQFLSAHGHPIDVALRWDSPRITRFKCSSSSQKGNKHAGYYVRHGDDGRPYGQLFCNRCDGLREGVTWQSGKSSEAKHVPSVISKPPETQLLNAKASLESGALWAKAIPCSAHPYLTRKNVLSYGLRARFGTLLVPMYDERFELVNLERIFIVDGKTAKVGMEGGRRKGIFGLIGALTASTDEIYLAEGYATGATIHEATGVPVVISFGCSNLRGAYETIKKIAPYCWVTTIADRNADGTGEREASKVGSYFLSPVPGDFNDWFNELLATSATRKDALDIINTHLHDKESTMKASIKYININSQGKVLGTYQNLECLTDFLGVCVRFNQMSHDIEIRYPGESLGEYELSEDQACQRLENDAKIYGYPYKEVKDNLVCLAFKNSYHPLREYVEAHSWDGVSRIDSFIGTLELDPELPIEIKLFYKTAIRKFLCSILASAFFDSNDFNRSSTQFVFILQGKGQIGKSYWFEDLLRFLNRSFSSGRNLNFNDKDSRLQVIRHALAELPEFEGTLNRNEMATLKAFITAKEDIDRVPYGRRSQKFIRRTVLCGTTNDINFLKDDDSNDRRLMIVPIVGKKFDHGIEPAQVFCELYEKGMFKKQYDYTLTSDETKILLGLNGQFESADGLYDAIYNTFNFEVDINPNLKWQQLSIEDIYQELPPIFGLLTHPLSIRIGNILIKKLNIKKIQPKRMRLYVLPPLRGVSRRLPSIR